MGVQLENRRLPSAMLYMACLAAQMGSVILGCTLGWSGPALADMARSDSKPRLTDSAHDTNIKTWIGSSMTLGALFGGIIGVFWSAADIIIFRRSLYSGLAVDELWSRGSVPTFVAEISTPNIRGLLGMAFN
ncbi:unnamed protein product, partial [Oppiella nova]